MHIFLYKARKEAKLTQTDLGEVIGVTPQQYRQREQNNMKISLEEASKFSEALGKPIQELFPEYFK